MPIEGGRTPNTGGLEQNSCVKQSQPEASTVPLPCQTVRIGTATTDAVQDESKAAEEVMEVVPDTRAYLTGQQPADKGGGGDAGRKRLGGRWYESDAACTTVTATTKEEGVVERTEGGGGGGGGYWYDPTDGSREDGRAWRMGKERRGRSIDGAVKQGGGGLACREQRTTTKGSRGKRWRCSKTRPGLPA